MRARDENGSHIGLALSGGAALGWAHIGAIRALHELGFHPHCVAGVSMGAIVGAAYAGEALDRLEAMALDFRPLDVARLSRVWLGRGGVLSNHRMADEVVGLMKYSRIEQLPMAFGAGCADLVSGNPVDLIAGSISTAIQASSAIPGVFRPIRLENQVLVDGGVINPVPVRLCRELGATQVIAIDVLQDYAARARASGFDPSSSGNAQRGPKVLWTSLALMLNQLALQSRALDAPDLAICPSVGRISPLAFQKADILIDLGYRAVLEQKEPILSLRAHARQNSRRSE